MTVKHPLDKAELESSILSIEHLESEKTEVSMQIKDIYDDLDRRGYDIKTVRMVIRMRKLTTDVMKSRQQLLNDYIDVLNN